VSHERVQTIAGTVGLFDVGSTLAVLDGTTILGMTVVEMDGTWSMPVTLEGYGPHPLVAEDTNVAGDAGRSAAVTFILDGAAVSIVPSDSAKVEDDSGGTTALTFTVTTTGDSSTTRSVACTYGEAV